jgi:ATP-binding cassette subfamily B (MDR/TAP) protein 1
LFFFAIFAFHAWILKAVDARLADVLQGVVSLVAGISVAFYFGWNVAPIGICTAVVLVLVQTRVSNYLKRRGMRDAHLADDSAKVFRHFRYLI